LCIAGRSEACSRRVGIRHGGTFVLWYCVDWLRIWKDVVRYVVGQND
jgi:hypothetical protein